MSATDQPIVQGQALVTPRCLRKVGLNVELQASDWGTLITRRTSKEPVEKGGWSIFHTWLVGPDIISPAVNFPLRGNGEKAWFGWPTDAKIEELMRRLVQGARPRGAEEARRRDPGRGLYDDVPYVPTGQFIVADRLPQEPRRHDHRAGRLPVERREEMSVQSAQRSPRAPRARADSLRDDDRADMFAYIIRRILATIPVMAVVALFVFSLLHLSPGRPGGDHRRRHRDRRRHRPHPRSSSASTSRSSSSSATWVWALLHGDLGISIFTNLPVIQADRAAGRADRRADALRR